MLTHKQMRVYMDDTLNNLLIKYSLMFLKHFKQIRNIKIIKYCIPWFSTRVRLLLLHRCPYKFKRKGMAVQWII